MEEAYKAAETPIRDFMYGQTQEKDLHLFMDIDARRLSGSDDTGALLRCSDDNRDSGIYLQRTSVLRLLSGFLIYIPFIVIDMVVASVLDVHGYDDAAADNDFTAV